MHARLNARAFLGYVVAIVPILVAAALMQVPPAGIAVLAVVATIAVFAASSLIKQELERPLHELIIGAQQVAAGDFKPIELSDAPKEFEALTASFNRMVDSLRSRDNQLQALNDEMSHRVRELNALYEVSRSVNSSLEVQEVLQTILNEIVKAFPTARKGLVHLIDESGERLIPIALSDTDRKLDPSMSLTINEGIAGRVVRERCSITLEDASDHPDFVDLGSNIRSLMVAPLEIGDSVIGALSLDSDQSNAFTSDMEVVFRSLANRAAIAIENARLYSESQKRVKELSTLYETALEFSGKQEQETLHEQLVERGIELMAGEGGVLYLSPPEEKRLQAVANINMPEEAIQQTYRFGEGLAGRVAETREPQLDSPAEETEAAPEEDQGAIVAVPLIWQSDILGVLEIHYESRKARLEPTEMRLLTLFAQQAASALENARLLGSQRKRSRQLALLNDLSRRFTSNLDIDRLMQEAVDGVEEAFGYGIVSIGLIEDEWFVMKASTVEETLASHESQRVGEDGIIGRVAATGQHYVANDVQNDPHYLPIFPDVKAELAVPIAGKEGVLGVLDLQEQRPNAFGRNDITLVQNLAMHLGIALENARLFDAAQKRAEQLAKLLEVTEELRRQQGLEPVLDRINEIVQKTLGWRTVALMLRDYESGTSKPMAVLCDDEALRERILATPPQPFGNAFWEDEQYRVSQSYFVRAEQLALSDDDQRMIRVDHGHREPWEWQSDDLLIIPIVGHAGVLGHLSVDDPVDRRRPALEQIQILEIFAHQAASAIEDTRLIEELQAKTTALEEANRNLSRASRLKSEFLANMSHELRTPLNAILGFSEILIDQAFGELNEKQLKYMNNINTSGQHLLDLINDILDLSKIEAGHMELMLEPFRLETALNEILTVIEPLAEKKQLNLRMVLDEAPDRIVADRLRFKQVLYNIIYNAVKFTPEQGDIDIHAWQNPEQMLHIRIRDTGIGIPDDQLEQIFDIFHRLDRSYRRETEGTGLGLALVRRFVELHGGDVTVDSTVGEGSTFTIILPQRQDATEAIEMAKGAEQ